MFRFLVFVVGCVGVIIFIASNSLEAMEAMRGGATIPVGFNDIGATEELVPDRALQVDGRRMAADREIQEPMILAAEDKLQDLEHALKSREQQEPERERLEKQKKGDDERQKKEEEARIQQEEARLAPICDPLKNKALAILKINGGQQGSVEAAENDLREIRSQLPTSCPARVVLFAGKVKSVIRCYNSAFAFELTNGERYIGTKDTRALNGLPRKSGESIIGITDQYYYCIQSTSPLAVLAGKHVQAMLRKDKNARR